MTDVSRELSATRPGAPSEDRGAANTRFVLVRHGQTAWSLSGQHTGITDLPLTEEGEAEASAISEVLNGHRFGLALASPRQRAQRTAELAGYGEQIQIEPNLAEFDYGAYEGLTTAQIREMRGGPWNLWRNGVPAGDTPGESAYDVQRRAYAVIDRALDVMWSGEDVVVFAHGHILRALGAAWLGLRPEDGSAFTLNTATVSVLGFEHGIPVVKRWNCPPGVLQFPAS